MRSFGIWLLIFAGMIGVMGAGTCFSQAVVRIDWVDKKIKDQPSSVSKGETVKVVVENVNDVFYDYKIGITFQTSSAGDDFAALAGILKPWAAITSPQDITSLAKKGASTTPCQDAEESAKKDFGTISRTINGWKLALDSKPSEPIALKDVKDGWEGNKEQLADLDVQILFLSNPANKCNSESFLSGPYRQIEELRKKINGEHIAMGNAEVESGDIESIKISVTESYKGKEIHPQEWTLNYSSPLTLSAGILFSTLENRSYIRSKIPTESGTATVVGVQDTNRPVPMIAALLNYRLPGFDSLTGQNKVGLDISSGLILRVSGKNDSSNLGFFSGISVNLWRRLFITPGLHVGQFSDYPMGFNRGQTIPSDFGELTPSKRWTARFGIAITYKTSTLGALTNKSTDTSNKKNSEGNQAKQPTK